MQHNRFAYPGCGTASQAVFFTRATVRLKTKFLWGCSMGVHPGTFPLDPPLSICARILVCEYKIMVETVVNLTKAKVQ